MASASKFCCSSAELPAGTGVLHCVTLDRLRVSCIPVQPAAQEKPESLSVGAFILRC